MNRVQFEQASRDYMNRYLDVDIALDTFPWPGGGTTCDALYMGVPVVSYYTERHSTRFTYSILANIGLSDLASTSLSDYVETAVALAGNLDLLDALHRELRDRMKASPVMDQAGYIREMEECYRAIWAKWESENKGLSTGISSCKTGVRCRSSREGAEPPARDGAGEFVPGGTPVGTA